MIGLIVCIIAMIFYELPKNIILDIYRKITSFWDFIPALKSDWKEITDTVKYNWSNDEAQTKNKR